MTDSSNKKPILHSTQLYTPLTPHQVHTRKPYYDEVELYELPSSDSNHWKRWTPAPQLQFLRSARAIPCPPHITYSGVFQQRKAEQEPTPLALAMRVQKHKNIASMPALKRAQHQHRGVQQRNKRALYYPVPPTPRQSIVYEGKYVRGLCKPFVMICWLVVLDRSR